MIEEKEYCPKCGERLIQKELPHEGMIPYCPSCQEYRFPLYSVAISMIVLSPDEKEILLIQQYGKKRYILVAGYVNKGEDAEDALKRELLEEVGLTLDTYHFNHSHYFSKTNTLMLNFTIRATSRNVIPNEEVDSYSWFSLSEAKEKIARPSLASQFLDGYLTGQYHFE